MISAITKGDYEAAESIANEIPNNGIPAKILCNKATVCMKAGSYDAAKALYKKCQDMEIARHNLGVLYLLDRKYAQAEPLLNEYDDINKAIVKVALGKYDEAHEVLSLIPDSDSKQKLLKMTEK
jgi:Flp pilus assembly protein TadD